MPWKVETTMSLKESFIRQALKEEESFSSLCKSYQISRTAGYLLLNRYKKEGLSGLNSRSRAPHRSPSKTSLKIEEQILAVRVQHPTWGARKIKAYLLRHGILELPAVSTITEILRRNGFLSEEESLKRQAFIRFERENCNDLWQMDFKGYFKLQSQEICHPLTILDDHSRFALELQACRNQQYQTVKERLEIVFKTYGLPNQINVDNGNPWGNPGGQSHTKLTVWLLRLGVRVSHSRPYHPQTNGKDERFHRTLKSDVISRYELSDFKYTQKIFNKWRDIYNYERPHEAIGMQVPGERYKESPRVMPDRLKDIEYATEAQVRKVRANGFISFNGKEYLVGKAFKRFYIEVRVNYPCEQLDLYFGEYKIYTYDLNNT